MATNKSPAAASRGKTVSSKAINGKATAEKATSQKTASKKAARKKAEVRDDPTTEEERPPEIDATDFRIISLLRKDGLMSSRDIAATLGHTEATIRGRLQRLEASKTMRVVAMTDFRAAGFNLMASIGVQVKDRSAVDVANDIAALEQVLNVQIVIGTTDIEISAGAGDGEELAQLMTTLGELPGVHRLIPGMALEVIKFQWGWVPFL